MTDVSNNIRIQIDGQKMDVIKLPAIKLANGKVLPIIKAEHGPSSPTIQNINYKAMEVLEMPTKVMAITTPNGIVTGLKITAKVRIIDVEYMRFGNIENVRVVREREVDISIVAEGILAFGKPKPIVQESPEQSAWKLNCIKMPPLGAPQKTTEQKLVPAKANKPVPQPSQALLGPARQVEKAVRGLNTLAPQKTKSATKLHLPKVTAKKPKSSLAEKAKSVVSAVGKLANALRSKEKGDADYMYDYNS